MQAFIAKPFYSLESLFLNLFLKGLLLTSVLKTNAYCKKKKKKKSCFNSFLNLSFSTINVGKTFTAAG